AMLSPTPPGRPDPRRGLFETLLVLSEQPVALERHLQRLSRSARDLYGVELPPRLAADAVAACAGVALGRERIDVTIGAGGAVDWKAVATAIDPDQFFPPWDRGATLCSVDAAEWSGAHKLADRDWLERKEVELGDAVPLLIGADEAVLEAGRANVFAVLDGALATPPLDGRILPGTARAATVELATELGLEVEARPLTREDLHRSGEVFLTSSVRGIRPARSLDGRSLPGHATTDRLATALRRRWLEA
ncbi:MAG TPA: aminotransferase class IV, partial [Solirubrobacterales bacterium]|nr:aminotransferase class IV [Solirubrobacterales bacterium]